MRRDCGADEKEEDAAPLAERYKKLSLILLRRVRVCGLKISMCVEQALGCSNALLISGH